MCWSLSNRRRMVLHYRSARLDSYQPDETFGIQATGHSQDEVHASLQARARWWSLFTQEYSNAGRLAAAGKEGFYFVSQHENLVQVTLGSQMLENYRSSYKVYGMSVKADMKIMAKGVSNFHLVQDHRVLVLGVSGSVTDLRTRRCSPLL